MPLFGSLKTSEKGNIFTWTLARERVEMNRDVLTSSPFGTVEQKFQLSFNRGTTLDPGDLFDNGVWRLILRCLNPNSPLMCKYNISINKHEEVIEARKDCCIFSTNHSETLVITRGVWEILDLSLGQIDIDVHCELSVSLAGENNSLNSESTKTNQVSKLNFDWMFLNEDFSDVALRTACGNEIPAHKIMLATASPVFKAMFNHDMLEKRSKIIDIIDVSHEAAVEMLRYIYTGGVGDIESKLTIEQLLAAAEKYHLEELKNKCEQLLSSKLSNEINLLEMLQFSDKYNADYLKKNTVDFIKRSINEQSDFHEISNIMLGKRQ